MRVLTLITFIFLSSSAFAGMADPSNPIGHLEVIGESRTEPKPVSTTEKIKEKVVNKIDEYTNLAKKKWSSWFPSEEEKAKRKAVADRKEKIKELKEALPTYITDNKKNIGETAVKAREIVKQQQPVREAKPGRVGTSDLPKTPVGVPQFSLYATKNVNSGKGKTKVIKIPKKEIPRLDIGEEPTIAKNDFMLPQFKIFQETYKEARALKSPPRIPAKDVEAWTKRQIAEIKGPQEIKRGDWNLRDVVTKDKIDSIALAMQEDNLQDIKPFVKFTRDDLKMVAAAILYKQGDKCHIVSGLLHDLSRTKKYQDESNLYLGVCAHKMGFTSETFRRLMPLVRGQHPEFGQEAVATLAKDLPREYQIEFSRVMRTKGAKFSSKAQIDEINYMIAKGAYHDDKYSVAREYASKVGQTSPRYPQAQYIAGIAEYVSGHSKRAQQTLSDLRKWMSDKGVKNKNLNSLIAVNLARMKFQNQDYKTAHQNFMKVGKDHSAWVRGLIEQGWTQVLIDDPAGAIGNMYSLHSPYFEAVFKPESYAVRTIGYLNICQYGDAYRTLTQGEELYRKWHDKVKAYVAKNKLAKDYYGTVKKYLSGNSQREVDGLPYQVIREVARRKNFLNWQEAINLKEDEIAQYGFIYKMITEDKGKLKWRRTKAKQELAKVNQDLKKAKSDKKLIRFVSQWQGQRRNQIRLIAKYDFLIGIYENGRKGFLRMKDQGFKRIAKEKYELREKAGRRLVVNLRDVKTEVNKVLENNEFLRYEIFAGSGQNIRFQVAGGKAASANRIPASIKPEKSLKWNFSGEYWEDEIGSYRSSLTNNCPGAHKMENFIKEKLENKEARLNGGKS